MCNSDKNVYTAWPKFDRAHFKIQKIMIHDMISLKSLITMILFIACFAFSQVSCEKNTEDNMSPPEDRCIEGISFQMDIKPIIESKCIQCHNGDVQPLDFKNYQTIKNNAARVKTLTASRVMPKQGSLTEEQIKLIGCWVDDGAPNN